MIEGLDENKLEVELEVLNPKLSLTREKVDEIFSAISDILTIDETCNISMDVPLYPISSVDARRKSVYNIFAMLKWLTEHDTDIITKEPLSQLTLPEKFYMNEALIGKINALFTRHNTSRAEILAYFNISPELDVYLRDFSFATPLEGRTSLSVEARFLFCFSAFMVAGLSSYYIVSRSFAAHIADRNLNFNKEVYDLLSQSFTWWRNFAGAQRTSPTCVMLRDRVADWFPDQIRECGTLAFQTVTLTTYIDKPQTEKYLYPGNSDLPNKIAISFALANAFFLGHLVYQASKNFPSHSKIRKALEYVFLAISITMALEAIFNITGFFDFSYNSTPVHNGCIKACNDGYAFVSYSPVEYEYKDFEFPREEAKQSASYGLKTFAAAASAPSLIKSCMSLFSKCRKANRSEEDTKLAKARREFAELKQNGYELKPSR